MVVDAIIKGNQKTFHKWKERYTMSGALLELFKPELEALAADMAQYMAQIQQKDATTSITLIAASCHLLVLFLYHSHQHR